MATINITPNSSADGLRTDLEDVARAHGVTLRALVQKIYSYATEHKSQFTGALKNARRTPGQHIGASVSEIVAQKLTSWAKERGTPRGVHCRYILEKALELKIIDDALR